MMLDKREPPYFFFFFPPFFLLLALYNIYLSILKYFSTDTVEDVTEWDLPTDVQVGKINFHVVNITVAIKN